MKTMRAIFLAAVMIHLAACEGTPGRDGIDGVNILGSVFEIEGDFTKDNQWMLYFEFPESIDVYESDVVLVYILWEQVSGTDGKPLDVWRLLPQTIVLDGGILQYNYDFTLADVQIFLGGTIDMNTLLPAESQDQVFRIVVMPADFVINNSLEISNYNLVMKFLGVNIDAVKKISLTDISKLNIK